MAPPHNTVTKKTQDEDANTDTQEHLLYDLQHLDTRYELLLEHLGCFIIQCRCLSKNRKEDDC